MKDNIIVTCLVFLCGLIILRAYMALTTYLAFSKKERKKYQADCTLVDRWFFLSAHKIMKNKYSKYEKRTIFLVRKFAKSYKSERAGRQQKLTISNRGRPSQTYLITDLRQSQTFLIVTCAIQQLDTSNCKRGPGLTKGRNSTLYESRKRGRPASLL